MPRLFGRLVAMVGAAAILTATFATAVRGQRRGQGSICDSGRRIEKRTYLFAETNKKLEYDVFVSSRVSRQTPAPLVIALHGQNQPPESVLRCVTDVAESGGYIVAAPTGYSLDGWYGMANHIPPGTKPADLAALSEKDVMNVLGAMQRDYNVDRRRIYLLGQSMGGGGALYLGTKYHELWAAVAASAPAAGGLPFGILDQAIEVPMVLVQGDADDNVSPERTRQWAEKMRALKMTVEYDELRGVGHREAIAVGAPKIFAFFDRHSKTAR
jgi:poly(3-hydroxybutyrate) depolymerase